MGDATATATSTLICQEDGTEFLVDAARFSVAGDEHLLMLDRDEEYVALLLSKERAVASGGGGSQAEEMEGWMQSARAESVRWIIKVVDAFFSILPIESLQLGNEFELFDGSCGFLLLLQTNASFQFSAKTAYVAVTYLDRFLAHRRVDRGKEWALQLLAVACLSLAAKVEEPRVPLLPEFRSDEYNFNSSSISRMELLILGTLNWHMITVTPFSYLSCLAVKFQHDERNALIRRAAECIFASLKVMNLVEHQPSTIAAAAILAAHNKELSPDLIDLEMFLGSSWHQFDTGHVYSCYSVMIQEDKSMQSREVASSNVSVARIGSLNSSMDANIASTSTATPDNKRQRLYTPQAQ